MNLADLVILLIVAVALFFALRHMKKTKGRCSCGCADCSGCAGCSGQNTKKE